jgi:phage/plasmid-associated DNA primase
MVVGLIIITFVIVSLKKYVLLWMIIGAKKFFDDEHLDIPDDEILKFENLSYLNELDSVQRFIDECCIIGKDEKELVSTVKEHYNKFCADESIPAIKPSKLKDTLSRKYEIKKNRKVCMITLYILN